MTDPGGLGYVLVDVGGFRRLERFGPYVLDRPAPVAGWPVRDVGAWAAADARYEPVAAGRGRWQARRQLPDAWDVDLEGLRMEIRPAPSGQVGLFPEHVAVARWAGDRVRASASRLGRPPRVLNLFAGGGLVTLAVARAGGSVAHVDASRPAVARARSSAERSGLAAASIRWLVDDAARFAGREARRGRSYDGAVLDPPTYGHGPAGHPWALDEDLAGLLATVAGLLAPGGFLAVTAHARDLDPGRLAASIEEALLGRLATARSAALEIVAQDGRRLPCGWAVLADLA